jgi:uncharacterized spore protein YtfJ
LDGSREVVQMASNSEVLETIERAKDAVTVKRVFGDPYEKDDVIVIPAARVQGGGGAGGGEAPDGSAQGSGGGFGVNAKPAGAFVIHGDEVQWRPAIDVNRIILGGQLIAVAALLLAAAVIRSRRRDA